MTRARRPVDAVFFDVDFTLIHPGPTFQGAGYRDFCARQGISVDPALFDRAVAAASGGDLKPVVDSLLAEMRDGLPG